MIKKNSVGPKNRNRKKTSTLYCISKTTVCYIQVKLKEEKNATSGKENDTKQAKENEKKGGKFFVERFVVFL